MDVMYKTGIIQIGQNINHHGQLSTIPVPVIFKMKNKINIPPSNAIIV